MYNLLGHVLTNNTQELQKNVFDIKTEQLKPDDYVLAMGFNILYRLNNQVEDTESKKPDASMVTMKQRRIHYTTGFIEAKSFKSNKGTLETYKDTLRLTITIRNRME
ncbi:unnamed protein product [Rhizopus stolonifer]